MIDTEDWYSNPLFDYNTYDGRNFAAHSGPDSDDFLLYLGYSNNGWTIIPSFNYERHGLTHPYVRIYERANTLVDDDFFGQYYLNDDRQVYRGISNLPEAKFEFRLDLRLYMKGFRISFYYEYEYVLNYLFLDNATIDSISRRKGNVFWLGIEKEINSIINNIFN
jgi:hypothetical protein